LNNIAIIPARAGSKSIINKNLIKLDGKETITERTMRQAKESGLFRDIILTTDIPVLIEDHEECVRKRPDHLCTDEALMNEVVKDVINYKGLNKNDWIWLLQPTTPFRKQKHFQDIKSIIHTNELLKSVVSVQDVEAFHPNRMYTIKNNCLFRLRHTSFKNKQDLPNVFIRNGAYYVIRVSDFIDNNSFHTKNCYGYKMGHKESINIDSKDDLDYARFLSMRGFLNE
jgi:CMP-N-acetylneuraminic acid synthetase